MAVFCTGVVVANKPCMVTIEDSGVYDDTGETLAKVTINGVDYASDDESVISTAPHYGKITVTTS